MLVHKPSYFDFGMLKLESKLDKSIGWEKWKVFCFIDYISSYKRLNTF